MSVFCVSLQTPLQKKIIASNLSTVVPHHSLNKNWEEYMFENMPTSAAVTLLSKLQSDIRYAEGEVLHTLVANVGLKDLRVNKTTSFCCTKSDTTLSRRNANGTNANGSNRLYTTNHKFM